jgi:Ca2+/H+ antiporter
MSGWLLIQVPAALAVHWLMPEAHSLVFGSAALAIIPLAGRMGRATEALAVLIAAPVPATASPTGSKGWRCSPSV